MVDEHLDGYASVDLTDVVTRSQLHVPQSSSREGNRINCPFCSATILETPKIIARHIGTHLDEVALKLLPQGEYDSDSDSDELDSGHSNSLQESVQSIYLEDAKNKNEGGTVVVVLQDGELCSAEGEISNYEVYIKLESFCSAVLRVFYLIRRIHEAQP